MPSPRLDCRDPSSKGICSGRKWYPRPGHCQTWKRVWTVPRPIWRRQADGSAVAGGIRVSLALSFAAGDDNASRVPAVREDKSQALQSRCIPLPLVVHFPFYGIWKGVQVPEAMSDFSFKKEQGLQTSSAQILYWNQSIVRQGTISPRHGKEKANRCSGSFCRAVSTPEAWRLERSVHEQRWREKSVHPVEQRVTKPSVLP